MDFLDILNGHTSVLNRFVRACMAPAGPFKCECLARKLAPHAAKFVILGCEEHTLTCVLNKISK